MMKRRMMVLVTIAVLAVSSPAMVVACQTEEAATNQEAATTTTSSSMGGLETFTTVAAWGSNSFGGLGNGTPLPYGTDSATPVEVSNLDGAELKAIAGGGSFSLALKNDGTVWAWGMNQSGQLGDVTYTLSTTTPGINTPVQVGELSAVKAIAAGVFHSLAGR